MDECGVVVEWWHRKDRRIERKPCPSVTLSTTNLTWTARGVNPELRGKRPATNRLGAGSLEPHPITRSPPTYRCTARTLCWVVLTYLLTPWSRVFLEKLTGSQLVKKFPAFYGTPRFITAFTSARHLSLSWTSSIQSTPPHPTSCRSILILSSHLRLWWAMWLIIDFIESDPFWEANSCPSCRNIPSTYANQNFGSPNAIQLSTNGVQMLKF